MDNAATLLESIRGRYPVFDRESSRASFDLGDLIQKYSWVTKDGNKPQLRLAKLNAVEPSQRLVGLDDDNAPIWFVATTFDEDRDGDIVVPSGVKTHNFIKNPVHFFGHQELAIPVAKGVDERGNLLWKVEDNRCLGASVFDTHDADAMFIRGKILRGFLNAVSIAFVPIKAFKRGPTEKANPRHEGSQPTGWVFEEVDLTEVSWVGVPANAEAIRDSLDREKSFISPKVQKVYGRYAAKSINEQGGCFTGWTCDPVTKQCKPCTKTPSQFSDDWTKPPKDKAEWVHRVDAILRRTKGRGLSTFGNVPLDWLYQQKYDPQQAAFAIVTHERGNWTLQNGQTVVSGNQKINPVLDKAEKAGNAVRSIVLSRGRVGNLLTSASHMGLKVMLREPYGTDMEEVTVAGPSTTVDRLLGLYKQASSTKKGNRMSVQKDQRHEWPSFASSAAARDLLTQQAPAELARWREVQSHHYQPLSGSWSINDRLNNRRKLEQAFNDLKRAWQRIQQGQKSYRKGGSHDLNIDRGPGWNPPRQLQVGKLRDDSTGGKTIYVIRDIITGKILYRGNDMRSSCDAEMRRLQSQKSHKKGCGSCGGTCPKCRGKKKQALATTSGSTGGYTVAPTKQEVVACYTRALAAGADPATACSRTEKRLGVTLDVRKDGTLRGFMRKALGALQKGNHHRRKEDYRGRGANGVRATSDNGKDWILVPASRDDGSSPVTPKTFRSKSEAEQWARSQGFKVKSFHKAEDPEEEAAEHGVDVDTAAEAMEEFPEDFAEEETPEEEEAEQEAIAEVQQTVSPLAAALAATHQHHMALKQYLEEQIEGQEKTKSTMEPEHHAVVDGHNELLRSLAQKAQETADEVGELFAKRYPDSDLEQVKSIVAGPPNDEGQASGLQGEDGYTEMDLDEEVEMEEPPIDEDEEYVSMDEEEMVEEDLDEDDEVEMEEDDEEVKGEEDAEEILDRYRQPLKGKRGVKKGPSQATAEVYVGGAFVQGIISGANASGIKVVDVTYGMDSGNGKNAYITLQGSRSAIQSLCRGKTGPVRFKSTKRTVAKGSTCMSEAHEFLQSLADSEQDPVKRAAMSHHAQKLKDEADGQVEMDLPLEDKAVEGEGMEEVGSMPEGEELIGAGEGDGLEELNEDEKQPAKSKAKSLINGVSALNKDTSLLTDGLLVLKRKLGIN